MNKNTGIYAFFDKNTNECLYVGMSSKLEQRRKEHLKNLRNGVALNSFQEWYNDNACNDLNRLDFRVIENCREDETAYQEMFWFKKLKPKFYGMEPSSKRYWKHSEETLKKLRKIKSENKKFNLSKEEIEDIYYNQNLSCYDLAELWSINVSTVYDRLKKFDIPTKEFLYRQKVKNRRYTCSLCKKKFKPKEKKIKTCSKECEKKLRQLNGGSLPPSRKGTSLSEKSRKKISSKLKGNSNATPEGTRLGAKISLHKRWHEKRGVVNKDCDLCVR